MKIGIVYLSYNNQEYLEKFLSPWLNAKEQKFKGHEFVISCVSVPFAEYKDIPEFQEDNETRLKLETLLTHEYIDYLIIDPPYISEAEARTAGMSPLLLPDIQIDKTTNQLKVVPPCDFVWLIDGDEAHDRETIGKALDFLEANQYASWFTFNYKNYIFDETHYLEDYFIPPRIFRIKTNGNTLQKFYFDNDVIYTEDSSGKEISYKSLSHVNFPNNIFAKHYTWLNNSTSKRKILYQNLHFQHGAGCSYKWNEEKKSVEFNQEYYTKIGAQIPTVIQD